MKQPYRFLLFIIVAICLTACSQTLRSPSISIDTPQVLGPPLEVEVLQAFHAADGLNLRLRVQALGEIDASQVLVGVSGLNEGKVIEEHLRRLSDATTLKAFSAGDSAVLLFRLTSVELSEFQVRVSWGADAILAAINDEPISAAAALVESGFEATDDECETPPCPRRFVLFGKILNSSPVILTGVDLAVGLKWVNDGQEASFAQPEAPLQDHEQLVELRGLTVEIERTQALRIQVDRLVPQVPGGSFLPYVRVLKAYGD